MNHLNIFLFFFISYSIFHANAQCSGLSTLTTFSSTFDDGSGSANYNNGLNCAWLIQPTGASFVEINITSFATEASYDFVTIYDGSSTNAAILSGPFSGTPSNIPVIYSTTGSVYITFTSDSSGNAQGWSLSYSGRIAGAIPTCSGRKYLTASSGTILDGSGSSNYTNNLDCEWIITVSTGLVNLSVSAIDTEVSDVITVYDGSTTGASVLASYSGTQVRYYVFSSGSTILIKFTSNAIGVSSGWSLYWLTASSPRPTCGGLYDYNSVYGTFSDGSGASFYTNSLVCQWLIAPSGASYVELDLLSFVTEASFDTLTFYDGSNTLAPVLTGPLSGTLNSGVIPPIYSAGSSVFVQFVTDGTNGYDGWSFNYTARVGTTPTCGGRIYLSGTSGTVSDGSGAGNYTNNLNCEWVITVSTGLVSLNVSSIDVEPNDSILVYDGTSTGATVLANFTGSSAIRYYTYASGSSVLVKFITNSNGVRAGWTLAWQSVSAPRPTCGGIYDLTSSYGTFTDGSSSLYSNFVNCQWLIAPTGASYIELDLLSFVTETSLDILTLYDGSTTASPVLSGPMSGTLSNIPPIFSTGNSVLAVFTTDSTNGYDGWTMNYTGRIGTAPTCGGRIYLSGVSGTVSDGSGAGNYTNNLNCEWIITVTTGLVSLNVSSIDTESTDIITVYDGTTTGASVLTTYSGSSAIRYYTYSSGSSVLVKFTTDGSGRRAGWTLAWQSVSAPRPTCGGIYDLTSAYGTFTDGSSSLYTNFLNCQWLIAPTGASYIELDLLSFVTETSLDILTLYDGSTTASPVLTGPMSGTLSNIPPIFSTGNSVLAVFTTDSTNGYDGWTMNYTGRIGTAPTCGGRVYLSGISGTVSDGSGTGNYTNNLNCEWVITVTTGLVSLNVSSIDTESTDVITVYDGTTTGASVLATYSGNSSIRYYIYSSGSSVLVKFTSDASGRRAGWTLAWQSASAPRPTCGGIYDLTSASGTFSDGSGSASYTNYLNCQWLIAPPLATYVQIFLVSFVTEASYDKLYFYDGNSTSSPVLAGPLSGTINSYPTITSTSGTVLVVWITDSTNGYAGWTFTYNSTFVPSPSPSATPLASASMSPGASTSPTPSITPSSTPSVTPTPSNSPSSSSSPSPSITPTPSVSVTPSSSVSSSPGASVTPTPSATPSISSSPTSSPSLGVSPSTSPSLAPASSSSPSSSFVPSASSSPSVDPSPSASPISLASPSISSFPSLAASSSVTPSPESGGDNAKSGGGISAALAAIIIVPVVVGIVAISAVAAFFIYRKTRQPKINSNLDKMGNESL